MLNVNQLKERQHILEWTSQRYQYYLAGRTLWFCGQMNTGALMLAYGIEAHMKQMLSRERKCPKKLLYDHDISKLFAKSREFGFFLDVAVSDDLITFAQDNFDRRYPSQTRATVENAISLDHALGMHIGHILAFDDLILQLDQSIWRTLNDIRASIALNGAKRVASSDGRFFWHSNYAMLELWEDVMKMLEEDFSLFLKEEHESIH
jgi:hypothetical protein